MAIRIFNDIEGNGQNLDQFEVTVETNAGVPTATSPDGTIVVDTTNDELYFRSSSTWNQAGGGGGGEDYFATTHTGTLPTVSGTDTLAIGEGSTATTTQSLAIGLNANAVSGNPSFPAIAIGANSSATGNFYSLAIGVQTVASHDRTVALGFGADATDSNAIAIGSNAQSTNNDSIAIGANALADGNECISIGHDADSGPNENVAIGDGASCTGTQGVAIGVGANCSSAAVALGEFSSAASASVCIGGNFASATGISSIAIGDNADATADDACQLGTGTNNTASTLQFLNNTIADANGVKVSFSGAQFTREFSPLFSAPDSATTIVQWSATPFFDTGSYIQGGSLTTFTIPVDGWYHFTYQLSTTAVLTGGYFSLQIYRSNVSNISLINQTFNPVNPGAVTNVYQVSGMYRLDAGNQIVARISNQTGTAITVSGISYFNIYQVGAV